MYSMYIMTKIGKTDLLFTEALLVIRGCFKFVKCCELEGGGRQIVFEVLGRVPKQNTTYHAKVGVNIKIGSLCYMKG